MTIRILCMTISMLGLVATAAADEPRASCEDQAKACLATCGQGDAGSAQLCQAQCWSGQRSCSVMQQAASSPASKL